MTKRLEYREGHADLVESLLKKAGLTIPGRIATLLLPIVLVTAPGTNAFAQTRAAPQGEFAPRTVSLANLDAFRATSANWIVAAGVTPGRILPVALPPLPGAGVLMNRPSPGATGPLFTTWEHGDLDLSFDVLLPKGARAGIYLMGRYEVRLADSWGTRSAALTDLGALPPRWDVTRGAGREAVGGTPPRQNASRAPGLWQHIDISFRAPRFDGHRKIANARFARVTVNGVVVHENVEVAGPSRDAAFDDERPTGPLMFPGDRGALGLRNVRYKLFTGPVVMSPLRYRAFEGEAMDSSFAATHAPVREGVATAFAPDPVGTPDKFALSYDGTITVPATGVYRFQLDLGWIGPDSATRGVSVGGGRLTIDGKPALLHTGAERRATGDVELKAGPHPFVMEYYKNRPFFGRRDVQVWVEGPGVERQPLHDEFSAAFGPPANPILVDPQMEPVVLRSFMRHGGTKRVIVASVADPLGVHYSYDLAQGALLYVWRGPFLETTQMWHERGEDQLAEPLGGAISLAGTPALAFLGSANTAWPDSLDESVYRRGGYTLDKLGRPTFLAQLRGIAVEDNIRPAADGLTLSRELHLRAPATSTAPPGLFVQLARGEHITRQPDGSYVVGDRSFYITLPAGSPLPAIRRQNEHDELLLPVKFARGAASVAYTIVW